MRGLIFGAHPAGARVTSNVGRQETAHRLACLTVRALHYLFDRRTLYR